MASKSEESILRSRLIVEDRTLKRCLRQLSTLCTRSPQLTCQEAQHASKHVLQEVRWFRHTVQVAVQSQQRCLDELHIYTSQQTRLEAQIDETSREIERLSDSLEESRNHKRHKISYDEIAREANQLPSRKQLDEEILQINADVEQLEQEQASHDMVAQSLDAQYEVVLDELNKLADMSKSALSMQDLDIYLDASNLEKPDGNVRSAMSPAATPHAFDTPIDADMLDVQDVSSDEEDPEDGLVETDSMAGSEEGECEDEEGELIG
ncbi:hypothetical protein EV183_004017 [Coemansia sp. RSA 2336]|nr:hypothetical protein EV183_004017 [Coemansia sp. RSA 2336]